MNGTEEKPLTKPCSSSGKTPDSKSGDGGSNPPQGARFDASQEFKLRIDDAAFSLLPDPEFDQVLKEYQYLKHAALKAGWVVRTWHDIEKRQRVSEFTPPGSETP